MPRSCNIISDENVNELHERSGVHAVECRDALLRCKGDILLAEGYLKFSKSDPPNQYADQATWAMTQAYMWKQSYLSGLTE